MCESWADTAHTWTICFAPPETRQIQFNKQSQCSSHSQNWKSVPRNIVSIINLQCVPIDTNWKLIRHRHRRDETLARVTYRHLSRMWTIPWIRADIKVLFTPSTHCYVTSGRIIPLRRPMSMHTDFVHLWLGDRVILRRWGRDHSLLSINDVQALASGNDNKRSPDQVHS